MRYFLLIFVVCVAAVIGLAGKRGGRVKPLSALRDPKINYPEDVVLPVAVSTGCRRSSRSKGVTRCSIF